MMGRKMDELLGYGKSEHHNSAESRNGYKAKMVNRNYGNVNIEVP